MPNFSKPYRCHLCKSPTDIISIVGLHYLLKCQKCSATRHETTEDLGYTGINDGQDQYDNDIDYDG
jgi:hypothetical protein